jgi:hypothetical protein
VRPLRLLALVLAAAALLVVAPSVRADGKGAQTFTQNFHDATDTFVDVIPCTSNPATITITYNGVLHFTVNKAGDFWATGTMTGTFVAVPLDPSLPTFTGHFTTWFGEADNKQNGVDHETFTVHGTGSDGSSIKFHETAHVSTNANGDVVVSFDKTSC